MGNALPSIVDFGPERPEVESLEETFDAHGSLTVGENKDWQARSYRQDKIDIGKAYCWASSKAWPSCLKVPASYA